MSCFLLLSHVDFEYDSAAELLFNDLTVQFPVGWTGIIGSNGSGKSTLLKLLTGAEIPDSGQIKNSGNSHLCEQEVLSPPSGLNDLFKAHDVYAFRLRQNFNLEPDMPERWNTLSMGERKKLQIATALFSKPGILCIDEPTNHLDAAGREQLASELKNYRGIGVLVSHDRELLNMLCSQCLFLECGNAILRSGGVSAGLELARTETEIRLKLQQQLKLELKRNKRELQRRREKEQLSQNRNSKRKLGKNDHDAKERIDLARVTSRSRAASDSAGAQALVVAKNVSELEASGRVKIKKLGLNIPYGCYSNKNVLLDFKGRKINLGTERTLVVPELVIENKDCIALSGINGSGKSTLLRQIVNELKITPNEYLYMPQELEISLTDEIYSSLRQLSRDNFSKVMNVVASLGSRPERVLDSRSCSPGEWRKLFFGLGVLRSTSLIIMDEPTNHLDLPSIECFEAALAECKSALLLISHDRILLNHLCSIHWHIEAESKSENILKKSYKTKTISHSDFEY